MSDKPIIFSAPMVRALLDGRKTQTRRVLKAKSGILAARSVLQRGAHWLGIEYDRAWPLRLPYAPGDRLYMREHWRTARAYDDLAPSEMGGEEPVKYEANGTEQMWGWPDLFLPGRFRQGMHMPRWASRITLTVTEVRVQRLQEISEADAVAEGVEPLHTGFFPYGITTFITTFIGDREVPAQCCRTARHSYEMLWNSLHGPDAWDANTWVWAVSFTVQRGNIDQIGGAQ